MAYVLATTDQKVRWYSYKSNLELETGKFEIIDILDLSLVPRLIDKDTAKCTAKSLGLKTWRYVKID